MNETAYITVKEPNGNYNDFVRFMNATTIGLKGSAMTGKVDFSKCQGDKLEWVVLDQMKSLAKEFNFNPENIRHAEKQHFPDIISENYYGVEVKATKENSWTSTGSSITESLREDCVKKVFLLFGKLSVPNVDFRCKPYEECLYDISVTHNPRYLINMDLAKDEVTIFQKLGIDYDSFRLDNNRINIIRDYYRDKYKSNGKEMPWWIGEESDNNRIRNEGSVRLYTSASKTEKDYLTLCGFILFPEVIMSQYQKFALWMCSRHSILNPSMRDMYSAGGKMNIYIDGKEKISGVPKSICNFLMSIDSIRYIFNEKCDVYDEIFYYSDYYKKTKDPYREWKKAINKYVKKVLQLDIDEIMCLTFKGVECYKNLMMETIKE